MRQPCFLTLLKGFFFIAAFFDGCACSQAPTYIDFASCGTANLTSSDCSEARTAKLLPSGLSVIGCAGGLRVFDPERRILHSNPEASTTTRIRAVEIIDENTLLVIGRDSRRLEVCTWAPGLNTFTCETLPGSINYAIHAMVYVPIRGRRSTLMVTEDNRVVYVDIDNPESQEVFIMSNHRSDVPTAPVFDRDRGFAVAEFEGNAFFGSNNGVLVRVSRASGNLQVTGQFAACCKHKAYVVDGNKRLLYVLSDVGVLFGVDIDTLAIKTSVFVGDGVEVMAMDGEYAVMYVASYNPIVVYRVDLTSMVVVAQSDPLPDVSNAYALTLADDLLNVYTQVGDSIGVVSAYNCSVLSSCSTCQDDVYCVWCASSGGCVPKREVTAACASPLPADQCPDVASVSPPSISVNGGESVTVTLATPVSVPSGVLGCSFGGGPARPATLSPDGQTLTCTTGAASYAVPSTVDLHFCVTLDGMPLSRAVDMKAYNCTAQAICENCLEHPLCGWCYDGQSRCMPGGECPNAALETHTCPKIPSVSPFKVGIVGSAQLLTFAGDFFYSPSPNAALEKYVCEFTTIEEGTYSVPATATSSSSLQCTLPPVTSFQSVPVTILFEAEPYLSPRVVRRFGFEADYYNLEDRSFSGAPFVSAIVPAVNFDFNTAPPAPGRTDNFGARWTTFFFVPEPNDYTFCTTTSDGVRLFLNGDLIINQWQMQTSTEACSAPVFLDTNVESPELVMEFFLVAAPGNAILTVASSALPKQVVTSHASLIPVDPVQRVEVFDCYSASDAIDCTGNSIGCAYCFDTDGAATGACSIASDSQPCVDPEGPINTTPSISQISPASMQFGTATVFTLTGTGFREGMQCDFDLGAAGVYATNATTFSSTAATCPAPPQSAFEFVACGQYAQVGLQDRSATSFYSAALNTAAGVLGGSHAWCGRTCCEPSEWYQLDLLAVRTVEGVETQGRNNVNQWITSYRIETSVNGVDFTVVPPGSFSGNTDWGTRVRQMFPSPVVARYVRLHPLARQHWNCMRIDAIVCDDAYKFEGDAKLSLSFLNQPFAAPKPFLVFDCGTTEDTCAACTAADKQGCGWCPKLRSCQPDFFCTQYDPVGVLKGCPESLRVRPDTCATHGETPLAITSSVLPSAAAGAGLFQCVFGEDTRVPASIVSSVELSCPAPSQESVGTVSVSVEYDGGLWDITPSSLSVSYYDCSPPGSAVSCQACLSLTSGLDECTWCSDENRCASFRDCNLGKIDSCPAIAAAMASADVSVSGQSLAVPISGLVMSSPADYVCQFDGVPVTASDLTTNALNVSYVVCDVPAHPPGKGSLAILFKGQPFVNTSVVLTYVCHVDAVVQADVCACRPGFEGDGIACAACPNGTYKDSAGTAACSVCPENAAPVPARDACECLSGYFESADSSALVCLSGQGALVVPEEGGTAAVVLGVTMPLLIICMCAIAVAAFVIVTKTTAEDTTPQPPALTPKLLEDLVFGELPGPVPSKGEAERLENISSFLRDDADGMFGHEPFAFVNSLCDFVPSHSAELLSRSLVIFYEANGGADDVIKARVSHEMKLCSSINTAFRLNSVATKMFSLYAKMKGLHYLNSELGPVLNQVLQEGAVEVDESKISGNADVAVNRFTLMISTQKIASAIFTSKDTVPVEFRRLFKHVQDEFDKKFAGQGGGFDAERMMEESIDAHIDATCSSAIFENLKGARVDGPEKLQLLRSFFDSYDEMHSRLEELKGLARDLEAVADPNSKAAAEVAKRQRRTNNSIAVGGFFFLRLVVPAITFPENYALVVDPPSSEGRRHLTLVAKVLQNLSNNKYFTNKEVFMSKMNGWIDENLERLHEFFEELTGGIPGGDPPTAAVPAPQLAVAISKLHDLMEETQSPLSDYFRSAGDYQLRSVKIPALRQGQDILEKWNDAMVAASPLVGPATASLRLLDPETEAECAELQKRIEEVVVEMENLDTSNEEGQARFKALRKKKIAMQTEMEDVKNGRKQGKQEEDDEFTALLPRDNGNGRSPRLSSKRESGAEDGDSTTGLSQGVIEDPDSSTTDENMCEFCEARGASLACEECAMQYCDGCAARRHKKGRTVEHRLTPIMKTSE